MLEYEDSQWQRIAYQSWCSGLTVRGYPHGYASRTFSSHKDQHKILHDLYQDQLNPPYQGEDPTAVGNLLVQLPKRDQAFPSPLPWSKQAKVAVCFTYDVDLFDGLSYFPMRLAYWMYQSGKALQDRNYKQYLKIIHRAKHWSYLWLKNHDPILGFHDLLRTSHTYELPSDYFFLSVPHALSKEGRLYTFDDTRVQNLFENLKKIKAHVGLHASRYESQTTLGLLKQKRRLERAWGSEVSMIRHHYLQAKFPQSWWDLMKVGFTISSNVGHHPPHQGFITQSAWPYCVSNGKESLWEIPMAVMDSGSALVGSKLYATVHHLLEQMRFTGGVLVLNFHPHYQIPLESPYVCHQYKKIIELILRGRDQGWLCTLYLSQIRKILNQRRQALHSLLDTC